MAIRYLTAGESHGKALTGIMEGLPAGLGLSTGDIDPDLKRRQGGYGRGGRMKIESDRAEILSGVRWGKTLGSPLTLQITNRDFKNWKEGMSADAADEGAIDPVTRPRPGHADLSGALKYGHDDVRNVLERSSARETAMRVALGAVGKRLLAEFGIRLGSFVSRVGFVTYRVDDLDPKKLASLHEKAEASDVRCPDKETTKNMKKAIDLAREEGNSLGGIFTVFALGVPPGLGSHVHWDRRLDGKLAQALMSIQAIKGVEVGLGFEAARRFGSDAMDEIVPQKDKNALAPYGRSTNNAGGIEGGISNGMPVVLRAAMKPIPTLKTPLHSVDMKTGKPIKAAYERSDICAVPAASVIGEAMAALVLADAFMEKFGGDSIGEIRNNYTSFVKSLRKK